MPRLNFAEPAQRPTFQAVRPERLNPGPCALSPDDIVRLSTLGLATLEVAHDLGNLLQVAGSAMRIIDRSLIGAPRSDLDPIIGGALASIERATILSRRVLDTGTPRTVGRDVVYLDTLLNGMRDEILLAVGPYVQLVLELGDYVPGISCEKADLENVILNLVANARDAMGSEGRLTLSVARDAPLGDEARGRPDVVLSVTDTGCGMSPLVAAQAFRPFFTTKTRDRGTGLGLAMVGAFAARVGGTAEITSAVGEGTTIILRLPSSGG